MHYSLFLPIILSILSSVFGVPISSGAQSSADISSSHRRHSVVEALPVPRLKSRMLGKLPRPAYQPTEEEMGITEATEIRQAVERQKEAKKQEKIVRETQKKAHRKTERKAKLAKAAERKTVKAAWKAYMSKNFPTEKKRKEAKTKAETAAFLNAKQERLNRLMPPAPKRPG